MKYNTLFSLNNFLNQTDGMINYTLGTTLTFFYGIIREFFPNGAPPHPFGNPSFKNKILGDFFLNIFFSHFRVI